MIEINILYLILYYSVLYCDKSDMLIVVPLVFNCSMLVRLLHQTITLNRCSLLCHESEFN